MLPDITLTEIQSHFEPQPFTWSSNSQIYKSWDGRRIIKFHGTQHELEMMLAAGDCSVQPLQRIVWAGEDSNPCIAGFTMARETPLDVTGISPDQCKAVMAGMVSCVLTLHQMGIVHGDIKPANMLICADGKVRLCDFDEARRINDNPANWDGSVTVNYVSPHRYQAWPNSRDPPPVAQDDLYALGLSIWELYVGKIPFDDIYEDDIRDILKTGRTVDVGEVVDEVARVATIQYLRYGGARV